LNRLWLKRLIYIHNYRVITKSKDFVGIKMTNERKLTIEERIAAKVVTYKAKVQAREQTIVEKRLAAYQRLMENRRAVFERTDKENRINLLPYNSDFCLIMEWEHERERTITRKEFVEGIKSNLADTGLVNPEVIAEYKSYLNEDRNTPYARRPLSEIIRGLF
jgi:hypothetical protein